MNARGGGFERHMRRIVALLLALAALAERAAGRPGPVRHCVLWFLRRGEAVANDYVLALTGQIACAAAPDLCEDDAIRLATRLRALAATLAAFIEAIADAVIRAFAWPARAVPPALAAFAGAPRPIERRDNS